MTQFDALQLAITFLEHSSFADDNREALELLRTIGTKAASAWNKPLAEQAIRTWINAHGRVPRVGELKGSELPSAYTLSKLFGKSASIVLREVFEQPYMRRHCDVTYAALSTNELIEAFRSEYEYIQPANRMEFDRLRRTGVPAWETFAKYLGVNTWNELLRLVGFADKCGRGRYTPIKSMNVQVTSNLADQLREYINSTESKE